MCLPLILFVSPTLSPFTFIPLERGVGLFLAPPPNQNTSTLERPNLLEKKSLFPLYVSMSGSMCLCVC